jgi:hypothetical protein
VLIKICLASIPIYLLSFIKFPKWGIRLLEFQMAHCLWNNTADCHRYHLASWQHVTMLKEYGGMGVPSIRAESMFVRFLVKKVLFRWGGGRGEFGRTLWILSTTLVTLMSSPVEMLWLPIFERVCSGQLE